MELNNKDWSGILEDAVSKKRRDKAAAMKAKHDHSQLRVDNIIAEVVV